ncbi:hypothetical protein NFI96_001474 [Prochilodus magdalenae]|nr:hypothetical protein NFI96_001474 [Prochilodus magdalenae]
MRLRKGAFRLPSQIRIVSRSSSEISREDRRWNKEYVSVPAVQDRTRRQAVCLPSDQKSHKEPHLQGQPPNCTAPPTRGWWADTNPSQDLTNGPQSGGLLNHLSAGRSLYWWMTSMSELEWPLASPSPLPQCDYSEWGGTRVVIPAVYLLAFVAGTLGNGLVLWAYLDRRGRGRSNSQLEESREHSPGPSSTPRTATESLIASLALADLAFVMTLPLWAAYTALDYHWPFGGALCRASSYLVALNMYASVFSLTALSVERYCVITRSNSNNSMQSKTTARACWVVGTVWVAACTLALPALLLRAVREVQRLETGSGDDWLEEEDSGNSDGGATICLCDMDYSSVLPADLDPMARERAELIWSAALGLKSTLLGFLLPLIVLLLCYCSLGRLLFRHFSLGPRPDRQRQRRFLRVIVTLVLAFFLCWLPFHVNKTLSALVELDLLPYSCGFDRWLVAAHPYAICLGYVNSCLNPLLYACCDPAFRRRCRGVIQYSWRMSSRKGAKEEREPPSKSSAMLSGTKEEMEEDEERGSVVEGDPEKVEEHKQYERREEAEFLYGLPQAEHTAGHFTEKQIYDPLVDLDSSDHMTFLHRSRVQSLRSLAD